VPGVIDTLRVTMGWAWTYLVVAELVARRVGGREAAGYFTGRLPLRPVSLEAVTGDYAYADIPVPKAAPL